MTAQRILIVDDDPLILKALRMVLESDRHHVTIACGGAAGIAALEAAHGAAQPFDVVMTDLHMPGIEGHAVARAVKAIAPATAVVLMTGSIDPTAIEHTPADMILSKPPSRTELRTALRALEERRAGLAVDPRPHAVSR
jgi:CheY-like chemotaxis protein